MPRRVAGQTRSRRSGLSHADPKKKGRRGLRSAAANTNP
jgi:hypothetical protein